MRIAGLAFASRYPRAGSPMLQLWISLGLTSLAIDANAFASRNPKALALGLMGTVKDAGFSPWGMPSYPWHSLIGKWSALNLSPGQAR
jgi:hypothetical protein